MVFRSNVKQCVPEREIEAEGATYFPVTTTSKIRIVVENIWASVKFEKLES
jgi:hypothetical protein